MAIAPMNEFQGNANRELVEAVSRMRTRFGEATGLPLALRPLE
jgi:hypothetical protein